MTRYVNIFFEVFIEVFIDLTTNIKLLQIVGVYIRLHISEQSLT